MFDIETFRCVFSEFSNEAEWKSKAISFWAELSEKQLDKCVFKSSYEMATYLYVAHHLVTAKKDSFASEISPMAVGNVKGVQTSKSVDGVSTSSDVSSILHAGAGYWNTTSYGIRLYDLIKLYGAGAVQLL